MKLDRELKINVPKSMWNFPKCVVLPRWRENSSRVLRKYTEEQKVNTWVAYRLQYLSNQANAPQNATLIEAPPQGDHRQMRKMFQCDMSKKPTGFPVQLYSGFKMPSKLKSKGMEGKKRGRGREQGDEEGKRWGKERGRSFSGWLGI